MNPLLRNILALVAGLIVGGLVNGGLVSAGGMFVDLPEGVDPNNLESIKANIHLYSPKHFLFPFLAHALGSLVGAFTAAKLAVSSHMKLALFVGAFFLIGGITAVYLIGGPIWFIALDLIAAYIPMGWLGGYLAGARKLSE